MGVKLIMTMNDIEWGEQCLIKFGLLNDKENEIKNVSYRKIKNDESLHSAYLMI